MDNPAIFVILFFGFFYMIMLGVSVLMYVLQSLALYRLAKNRGIANYGLAWVPVGSSWLLGKLADDVNICRRNKKTHFARNLLILNLVYIGSFFVLYIGAIAVGISIGLQEATHGYSAAMAPGAIILIVLLYLALVGVMIAMMVLTYMALYRVYYGYAEENAVLYLVLSIFISFTQPIIMFIIRNRKLLPPDPSTFQQNGYPNMYTTVSTEDGNVNQQ